jgi:hypothetical protein
MRAYALAVALGLSVVALTAHPVRADAIDGAWCHDNDRRMMINGPVIVTPAGTRTQGDYSRHAFSYVIPTGDPGAGGTTEMQLINEDEVRVRAPPRMTAEIWRRCGPPVS